ncbi:hypothetical protein HGA91_04095 [candidate division WWE3 bacterium]|nr:hypothetical protein [candidate division WWE3 bacterium]
MSLHPETPEGSAVLALRIRYESRRGTWRDLSRPITLGELAIVPVSWFLMILGGAQLLTVWGELSFLLFPSYVELWIASLSLLIVVGIPAATLAHIVVRLFARFGGKELF